MDNTLHEVYLKFKDNPDDIFSAINYDNKEKMKQILIELNHNDNFDIIEYAVKAIEKGGDVFYIYVFLDDIISELKLNKENLFVYFKIINTSLQGDLISYKQYDQIQNITIKQPIFAEEFMEYLMLSNEIFVYQYIEEIILNLNKIDNKEKHSRFLVMANSDIEHKKICGINGLGRINYSNDNYDLLSKTLSCFDALIKQEHHIINGAITNSLRLLYYIGDKTISRLTDLSKRDDPFILMEITRFLYLEYEKICKEKYFERLLYSLVKINSEYLGIIKDMDMLLYSMIDKKGNIDLVIDFLIKWMATSDCKPDKIESLQLLESTFSIIFSKLIGKKENKNIVSFLSSCFVEYIGYNYPLTTIEYLERTLDDNELDITLKNIINNILSKIKIIFKERTDKQRLKELQPTKKDIYILRKEEWRINQKIGELADEKSILRQISSRSYIKYGKKVSYYENGNITEPQQLKSLSISMELPYSLLVDPVKFEEDSYNFRSVKRNNNALNN